MKDNLAMHWPLLVGLVLFLPAAWKYYSQGLISTDLNVQTHASHGGQSWLRELRKMARKSAWICCIRVYCSHLAEPLPKKERALHSCQGLALVRLLADVNEAGIKYPRLR